MTPPIGRAVYGKLAKAQKYLEVGKHEQAVEVLDGLLKKHAQKGLNSYELANLHNLYAYERYGKLDYTGSREHYLKVISQPDIPLAMEGNTRFTIAQLYMIEEEWELAIGMLLEWYELIHKPTKEGVMLMAQAYYQLEQFRPALLYTQSAIDLAKAQGGQPLKKWLDFKDFLIKELGLPAEPYLPYAAFPLTDYSNRYEHISSLVDVMKSPPSPSDRGMYESDAEYEARVDAFSRPAATVFFQERKLEFTVPDGSANVNFKVNPAAEHEVARETVSTAEVGQNAYGATAEFARVSGQVYRLAIKEYPKPFCSDSRDRTSSHEAVPLDRSLLIAQSSEVYLVRLIEISTDDPESFQSKRIQGSASWQLRTAVDIEEITVSGRILQAGLFDKKNSQWLAIFSPDFRQMYRLHDNAIIDLTALETAL